MTPFSRFPQFINLESEYFFINSVPFSLVWHLLESKYPIISHRFDVAALQEFLKVIPTPNISPKVEDGFNGNTTTTTLPSFDDQHDLKRVGGGAGGTLCSILCEGRQGKIPSVQCVKCLCLVHPECVGVPYALCIHDFVCRVSLLSHRANIKFIM